LLVCKRSQICNGPVEELKALDNFNPATTAFVDNSFKILSPGQPVYDSTATIRLVNYDNDNIKYETNAAAEQFAVLSEIIILAGWNAYIDGVKILTRKSITC